MTTRLPDLASSSTPDGPLGRAAREARAAMIPRDTANLVPALLWHSTADGTATWYNDRWIEHTGHLMDATLAVGWTAVVHAEDLAVTRAAWAAAVRTGDPLEVEQRLRGLDGSYRWFLVRAVPHRAPTDGASDDPIGWFWAACDVHRQRRAHDAVERGVAERMLERTTADAALRLAAWERDELRRQLAGAEEEERRRLARELHDEIGQHITALGLGLQALSDVTPAGSEVDRRAGVLRELAATLSRELHAVAVRLRPRVLDDFGLESALAAHVEEWSRQTGITVDLHTGVETERLPREVETALYRVIQEALTNVARHSGAAHASVVLERRDGQAVAVVEDGGRGFDLGAIQGRIDGLARLGLLGIRERVELLGGTMELESSREAGTTLYVRIPMNPMRDGRRAPDA